MLQSLICTFTGTRWRVYDVRKLMNLSINVKAFNGIKCLVIPIVGTLKRGQFCNPARLISITLKARCYDEPLLLDPRPSYQSTSGYVVYDICHYVFKLKQHVPWPPDIGHIQPIITYHSSAHIH